MRGSIAGLLLAASPAAAQLPLPPPVPRAPPQNCTAAEHRQLDFWLGHWNVFQTGTQTMVGAAHVEQIYNGCAIRETWRPFDMNEGGSVSSYDRVAGVWRQNWVDSTAERIDYAGRLDNGRMVLIAQRPARSGEAQRQTRVTQWRDGETVRQVGEMSVDGGRSWAPSYDYTYRPRPAG